MMFNDWKGIVIVVILFIIIAIIMLRVAYGMGKKDTSSIYMENSKE